MPNVRSRAVGPKRGKFHLKRWKLLLFQMKVGVINVGGDQNRASIGVFLVNAEQSGANLGLAPTAIAAHAGKRALDSGDLSVAPITLDLNQEKFLLFKVKFRSPNGTFLLIQMKLPAPHTDVDARRTDGDVAGVTLRSLRAALCAHEADGASIHGGVPSTGGSPATS